MSREFVHQFQRLSAALLTDREQVALHKSIAQYRRTRDLSRLVPTVREVLCTPERCRLLAYIRAPMGREERRRFDRLLGIHGEDNLAMAYDDYLDPIEYKGRIATPPGDTSWRERNVTIYGSRGESMGFSIRGGSEFGLGIYVSHVKPRSCAAHAGLEVGDQIIRANGVDFRCVANSGAVKVLSSSVLLNLAVVRSGKVPEWKVAQERVLWYDVAQTRIVPTPPVTEKHTPSALTRVIVERKVVINLADQSDFIGLNIRGGNEYGIGVYISRVDPGGLAARVGLSPGDQIVRVNDTDFLNITHTDAVETLRSSTNLIITIRSGGKFPVLKELCAEFSWTNGAQYKKGGSVASSGFRLVTFPVAANNGRRHVQRTRESSIDLSPLGATQVRNIYQLEDTELDVIDQEFQSKNFYPDESDIEFRRNYEDSWEDIESIIENPNEDMSVHRVNGTSVQRRKDSDFSGQLDYTTFLQRFSRRDDENPQVSRVIVNGDDDGDDDIPVIETYVEESVTDFTKTVPHQEESTPSYRRQHATHDHDVEAQISQRPHQTPSPKKLSSPQHSHYSEVDYYKKEVTSSEGVYAQVTDLTGKPPLEIYNQANGGEHSPDESAFPIYATVHKVDKTNWNNTSNNNNKGGMVNKNSFTQQQANRIELSEDILKTQLARLQARQSNLSTWELSKVTGESPNSSENLSEISSSESDKNKFGTWSSIKKKFGSIRIAGSGSRKRSSLSSDEDKASSSIGTMQQKGVFERSFGSQILNTSSSDRFNLMKVLEDHARVVLKEDEYKAVMRHVHNYQTDKDLNRLLQLLLTILDKPEKKSLLSDIRNVITPGHITQYDALLEKNNIHLPMLAEHVEVKLKDSDQKAQHKPQKPARAKTSGQSNGRPASFNISDQLQTSPLSSRPHSFSNDDFRNKQLNVVSAENHILARGGPVIKENEEIVYISKHKMILGLELTGGRNNADDKAIRIKTIVTGGAASDDGRLQTGVEITAVDTTSVIGMSCEEAESLLQRTFSHKNPANLGIHIKNGNLV